MNNKSIKIAATGDGDHTAMTDFIKRVDDAKQPAAAPVVRFASALGTQKVASALSDRFKVLKSLGASDACEFYLARETSSNNTVILKLLSGSAARDFRQRELFRLEAESAARLTHKNIVKTGEAETVNGIYFCVMEHSPAAESLRDLLRRKGWLEPGQAISIINQVADALAYAHSRGVLHLRLQPEKILLEPDGLVRIIDFGIDAGQQFVWAHTERSRRLPAEYQSAEQMCDASLDQRSDIYSLGVLLFEMLTDRLPFDSEDPDYIRRRHRMKHSPLPPHVLSWDVPEFISRVVMGLLEKNPNKRFSNATVFRLTLNRLASLDAESQIDAGDESFDGEGVLSGHAVEVLE
ncbi:MAG TPA: serine/threonine-protein kinase [Blastocatellia bacterium]|nr:serine/threonine-protein kinase [Blastocatellia bacterium]